MLNTVPSSRGLRRRKDGRSTDRNCSPFQGAGCGVPTRWMKVSQPVAENVVASNALPTWIAHPGGILWSDPCRARAVTECPRAISRGIKARPM